MRIAVLILGLILGAVMAGQTFLVYILSGIGNDEATSAAAAMGILMALLWLVACAAIMGVPLIAAGLFAVAGVIGSAMAKEFPDLTIWGNISFLLAIASLIGWRQKQREVRQEALRHDELVSAVRLAAPHQTVVPSGSVGFVDDSASHRPSTKDVSAAPDQANPSTMHCPHCGYSNDATSRFCSECGQRLRH